MANNSPAQNLVDLLVTHNFDVKVLDSDTGKPPVNSKTGKYDVENGNMFLFDYIGQSGKNYGTVEILLGPENNMVVGSGNNTGREIEDPEDKTAWFEFLQQLKQFSVRNNFMGFQVTNINRLKYFKQSMAQVTESFHGNRKYSFSGQPTEARLVIKHNRNMGEGDARFRYVESLFIETTDGERYKLGFKKLAGGRAMLEHVKAGGRPWDERGQHIASIVEQINTLAQFQRAHQGRLYEGQAAELIAETKQYYTNLKKNLKHMSTGTGYQRYFESWTPDTITETELVVEDLKTLFVEVRIDPRIEQALPTLARIQKGSQMKEADIFESWADRVMEGTWALPDTREAQARLQNLLSQELIVGADGTNAIEQLYDVVGDDQLFDIIGEIAAADPDANLWDDPRAMERLRELNVDIDIEPDSEPDQQEVAEGVPLGYSTDPAQGKWYHEGRKAYKYGTTGNTIQDIAKKHNVPAEWVKAFHAGYEDQQGWGKDDVAEGQCNMSEAGSYCPEHGLEECGTVAGGMAPVVMGEKDLTESNSTLARIKSLALLK